MIVDIYEPEMMALKLIGAIKPDKVSRVALKAADFVIADWDGCTLGVERKTWSDLLGSLGSGRLRRQLDRMQGMYHLTALLIEGKVKMDPNTHKVKTGVGQDRYRLTGWNHAAIQMFLWTVGERHRLLYSQHADTTVDILRALNQRSRDYCLRDGRKRDVDPASGFATRAGSLRGIQHVGNASGDEESSLRELESLHGDARNRGAALVVGGLALND